MRRILTLIFLVYLTLLPLSANGATYIVKKKGKRDFKSIQAAIEHAESGDELVVGPGVWSELVWRLDKDLDIRSEQGPETTVIDGTLTERGVYVTDGARVRLEGFTLTNCEANTGGALHVDEASDVVVRNCRFILNSAPNGGGAGFIRHAGTKAVFEDCLFKENHSPRNAGAVAGFDQAEVVFTDCWFEKNRADDLGGVVSAYDNVQLEIRSSVFVRNTGEYGIVMISQSPTLIENNTFYLNRVKGGVIYCNSDFPLQVYNNIISHVIHGSDYYVKSADPYELACNITWEEHLNKDTTEAAVRYVRIDPAFCDVEVHDLALCADSPALPGALDLLAGCGLIGAYDQGCEACLPVPTESVNWGTLKSMYR